MACRKGCSNGWSFLQADGYAGYGQVWRDNDLSRIGCWDHARRKFAEASNAAKPHIS